MTDLNDVYKWQKKANFLAPLENYARLGDKVNVQPFIEAVNARMSAEGDSAKGVSIWTLMDREHTCIISGSKRM